MKLPSPPPLTAKHIEERFKLLAGGLQALALALLGGVVIGPLLNASITAPLWARALTFTFCGAAEIAALILLRYIPIANSPKDQTPS